ncbi:MAG: S-layer protein, partial [Candidatus Hydrothermarchaeota archaeon]
MRLRKVGAVLSGALMMGATLAGAVAAQDVQVVGNVAGFPFVTDGAITSEIVVGSGAPAADVASAADIAAKIGSMAVKPAELV